MTRALTAFGGLIVAGFAIVFRLDEHVSRMVRIWRNERRRRRARGYVR